MDFEKLVSRVKNILTTPKTEWQVIANEPATVGSIYTGYAMILAAIPLIAGIVGSIIAGTGLTFGLVVGLCGYVIGLGLLYVMALIVDAVAPNFGGEKNIVNSLKLVVYASTAGWVVAILSIIPLLGAIAGLVGLIWNIYLLFLGAVPVKRVPQERSGGFTAVVIIAWIVLYFVLMLIVGAIVAATVGTAALMGAAAAG